MSRSERFVVLCDVVDSRDVADREALQSRLRNTCEVLNASYSALLFAEFDVLKGVDEFGGVFNTPVMLYQALDDLFEGLRPQELRIGIGVGTVDVEADSVSEMDGPAFHRASEALLRAENADTYVEMNSGGDVRDPGEDLFVATVHLVQTTKDEWTDRQREVVTLYEEMSSQSKVAKELGVSQPAVSKALRAARYEDVSRTETRLRAFARKVLN